MVRSGYPSARLGWMDTVLREAINTASSEAATPLRFMTAGRIAAHARSTGVIFPNVWYAQTEESVLRYVEDFRRLCTVSAKHQYRKIDAAREPPGGQCLEQGDFGAYLYETRHVPGARAKSRELPDPDTRRQSIAKRTSSLSQHHKS
jgi:hypothetical protein